MRDEARRAAEDAARHSYGRLVAWLAAQFRDIALAEEAVSEALARALETWPERGVPDNPAGWLATVAKRSILQGAQREARFEAAVPLLEMLGEERAEKEDAMFPDRRIDLMFACAHPSIEDGMHAPLILQSVLGFDAAAIGSAFLVRPAAMGQRLVRTKKKIAASGVPFQIPEAELLPERLPAVLEAVYAAFGLAWSDPADRHRRDLSEDAIWLARLLEAALPDEGEAKGLLALMMFSHARRAARRGPDGAYVPLDEQDVSAWDHALISEALEIFRRSSASSAPGRFRIEAAIQSVHCARAAFGSTHWPMLAKLYDDLWRVHPTIGVLVGRAAAASRLEGARAGLALLEEAPPEKTRAFQPFWATRADLLEQAGDGQAARIAYQRAAGLIEDAAVRDYLLKKAAGLSRP